jgi:hypothetical protein
MTIAAERVHELFKGRENCDGAAFFEQVAELGDNGFYRGTAPVQSRSGSAGQSSEMLV